MIDDLIIMDRHTANSLIADSGLHFKTVEIEFNPEEPLVLKSGKTLKYTFLETIDFLNDCRIRFDICTPKEGNYSPVNYLKEVSLLEETPNGMVELDESGVPKISKNAVLAVIENYSADNPQLMSINSLASYRIKNGHEVKCAFELLLGKWLPMPMYEVEMNGQSSGYPNGWCRVRIDAVGERQKNGTQRYRCVWAFDTRTAKDAVEGVLRPAFLGGSNEK